MILLGSFFFFVFFLDHVMGAQVSHTNGLQHRQQGSALSPSRNEGADMMASRASSSHHQDAASSSSIRQSINKRRGRPPKLAPTSKVLKRRATSIRQKERRKERVAELLKAGLNPEDYKNKPGGQFLNDGAPPDVMQVREARRITKAMHREKKLAMKEGRLAPTPHITKGRVKDPTGTNHYTIVSRSIRAKAKERLAAAQEIVNKAGKANKEHEGQSEVASASVSVSASASTSTTKGTGMSLAEAFDLVNRHEAAKEKARDYQRERRSKGKAVGKADDQSQHTPQGSTSVHGQIDLNVEPPASPGIDLNRLPHLP
jgi:hypothetical protein